MTLGSIGTWIGKYRHQVESYYQETTKINLGVYIKYSFEICIFMQLYRVQLSELNLSMRLVLDQKELGIMGEAHTYSGIPADQDLNPE